MISRPRSGEPTSEKVEETLEGLYGDLRAELARLSTFPREIVEAAVLLMPFGSRAALETLGMVAIGDRSPFGVRAVNLTPLGEATLRQLATEPVADAGTEDFVYASYDLLKNAEEATNPSLLLDDPERQLTPLKLVVEHVEPEDGEQRTDLSWDELRDGRVQVAAVAAGQTDVIAHMAVAPTSNGVTISKESGAAELVVAATGEVIPGDGGPVEMRNLEHEAPPLMEIADRLAVYSGLADG